MSPPSRAEFVAGCRECGFTMGADSIEDVAWFYTCHRTVGHDVEWMWGADTTLTVEAQVTDGGKVANLSTVIGALAETFHPARVPAELVYEICLNAGAEKAPVERQLESLPETITDTVGSLD